MADKTDNRRLIRKLWGIAKSPELQLTDEDVHTIVGAQTKKDSIRALSARELQKVIRVLEDMQRSARRGSGRQGSRGNQATENQRKKIYRLTQVLGWDKPARVNGLCRRLFGVAAVEWLDYRQCVKLIEALKSMAERQAGQEAEGEDNGVSDAPV